MSKLSQITSHPYFPDAKVLAGFLAATVVAILMEFDVIVPPGSIGEQWITLVCYAAAAWLMKSKAATIILFTPEESAPEDPSDGEPR